MFRVGPVGEEAIKFINREWFKGILLPTQAEDLDTNGLPAMIEMGNPLKDRAEKKSVDAMVL